MKRLLPFQVRQQIAKLLRGQLLRQSVGHHRHGRSGARFNLVRSQEKEFSFGVDVPLATIDRLAQENADEGLAARRLDGPLHELRGDFLARMED